MPIKLMKKPKPDPVTEYYDVHVKLDPDDYSRVVELAREEDRPLSVMVRRIVHLWLTRGQ